MFTSYDLPPHTPASEVQRMYIPSCIWLKAKSKKANNRRQTGWHVSSQAASELYMKHVFN